MRKMTLARFKRIVSSRDWLTLPNCLTMFRLAVTPILMLLICCRDWNGALALFAVAAVTDFLDGYVARILRQETLLGVCLDPIADKCFFTGCLMALSFVADTVLFVPTWFFQLVLLKEILLVGGAMMLLFLCGHITLRPTGLAKITTTCQSLFIVGILMAMSCNSVAMALMLRAAVYPLSALMIVCFCDYAWSAGRSCGLVRDW